MPLQPSQSLILHRLTLPFSYSISIGSGIAEQFNDLSLVHADQVVLPQERSKKPEFFVRLVARFFPLRRAERLCALRDLSISYDSF